MNDEWLEIVRQMNPRQRSQVLAFVRAARKYPDTKPANLPGRVRALERRRARNRVARRQRKVNR